MNDMAITLTCEILGDGILDITIMVYWYRIQF